MLVSGCKKEIAQIYLEGGTAPTLSASVTGTIPLSFANQADPAIKLSWTNPNYRFTTGTSSQNVNYLLEIDTTGANFSNPSRQTISIAKDLSMTITHSQLNDYLLNQLVLKPKMPHNIEMRVKTSLGTNGAAALVSNVLKFTVTPYEIPPKVTPPPSGKLYIVGSATPGGWDNPVPDPAQLFTKVSETLYQITIRMVGGGSYLLLPVNGSWDAKYGGTGSNNANNVSGDDFKAGGGDLLAPAASGVYKIVVDFQRGKFTVTPQ
ncbi:hypothetical protein SAE01_21930 [Segetibacter aerophilus]|uniref:SusE outer membrane protein domain-containing protein n=2 Tax=Segetibacter aerophilus TaxID=670293 RepID=A0A512BCV9_9BACT|nr:hypothetical protein SAE01_21930 [Segetibacter aerophilus]